TDVDFDPRHLGGGMYNEDGNPTIRDCRFVRNRAGNEDEVGLGGAIYNLSSSPSISDCLFSDNWAKSNGGAIRNNVGSSPVITNTVFADNFAGAGAGIAYRDYQEPSNALLDHCLFVNNTAGAGGGVHVRGASSALLVDCVFSGNTSVGGGGGLVIRVVSGGVAEINRCIFSNNNGGVAAGGIAIVRGDTNLTDSVIAANAASFTGGGLLSGGEYTMVNCAISGNTAPMGGGLENAGLATLINCTFGNNVGNGVENSKSADSAVLANCVLWGNTPAQLEGDSFTVTYSDIQGGWPGIGNIDADPLFVQPAGDDLRLDFGSPCIDAGDNDAVPDGVTTDLDGNPRFQDDPDVKDTGNGTPPIVDMGAYEGGHEPQDPMASEDDFDQNEIILLIPNGGPFDPFFNAAVGVINTSGPDNATFAVTQIDWDLHPGAAGFSELGLILRTETTLKPGQFFMQLYIPFELEQLQGRDRALLDVTSFDDPSGNWVLAALLNTQDSPDRHGPIGDKIVVENPDDGWGTTTDFGDWGVVYDANLQRGFVWANVDYSDDFAFGIPFCPADCAPFGGDGVVGVVDLLQVLGGWGLTGASGPCDLDRDDDVDVTDLTLLLQGWGSCPQPAYGSPPTTPRAGAIANRSDQFPGRSFRGRLFRGRGDLDANGVVDQRDLHRLQANWGPCDNCPSDLDADGVVGTRDLLILLGNWGHTDL
ncbi:MAG: right-handed parallel beta-helix repeat-containing protein, partial [Planctomycetes bacterium]|nr:right-handed parallel beta-helix repeat-containing protein [Planctomycetota bacterium]